jgi:hypothetical protein
MLHLEVASSRLAVQALRCETLLDKQSCGCSSRTSGSSSSCSWRPVS